MHQEIDAVVAEIPSLRRYGRSLTGSRAAADDLVQDTLERAIQKFHLFEPGTKLRLWLFNIIRNIFFDYYRTARRVGMSRSTSRSSPPSIARPTRSTSSCIA